MAEYRQFTTGATRTPDDQKLDFDGFLSPLVLHRFARYMHKHRKRWDGTLRESDNWQKGIPVSSYVKSMFRHFFAVWARYRVRGKISDTELCALFFNVQGMLHETLQAKRKIKPQAQSGLMTWKQREKLCKMQIALMRARKRSAASRAQGTARNGQARSESSGPKRVAVSSSKKHRRSRASQG